MIPTIPALRLVRPPFLPALFAFLLVQAVEPAVDPSFRTKVEADWTTQESRLGRSPATPQAVSSVLSGALRLYDHLSSLENAPDLRDEARALQALSARAETLETLDTPGRYKLYKEIRWRTRSMAFRHPLFASKPLLFMKRRRFICQMLHEYLGYYYDYKDISGGGVYLLTNPGHSFETHDIIKSRLPRGNYTTLALSHDARTIYFAFAERAGKKPDFYSPERSCFHIFAVDSDGKNLRQITSGAEDDFDPRPLPDGGIAFMSSERGGFTRCNNPWEPLPAHTLHRLDPALEKRSTLSFHETSEWHPSVLHDGRIVYIRWDYVDRSAANFHGLWITRPDGTNAISLFGNYTMHINACYQPRAVPGSNRIVFLAGAHHADVGGSLVLLDPDRATLDPKTGQDLFESIEVLTPEICFPESTGWPKSYFHSPWPLSEDVFLVSFSFDPLPGMGSRVNEDTETGLYYFDRFGNMELLYREKGISAMYPIPLREREKPPIVPSCLDGALGEEGEFLLTDVTESHFPFPSARPIRKLRIFLVLPKSRTHVANDPRIGYANAESARMLLGTVPVERDGSAYFRAPAERALYFQAVDDRGRAVQTMRSVVYLQKGERRGCVGCHETPVLAPDNRHAPLAFSRAPSTIQPGPAGTRPFSFPLLIQPVLNEHCVRCHDGTSGENKSDLVLTGGSAGEFSKAYQNLRAFVRWYEWGGNSIEPIVTRPGRTGSTESPLVKVLDDSLHAKHVQIDEESRRRIHIWLDGNAPFYGTYETPERLAQKNGKNVQPPALQ